jgi:Spy/CpxP family protein refolding chaperone
MKRIYGITFIAALAVAPLALEAQTPGAQHEHAARGGHAFGMIIGQRAQLGLTDDQVARIEAIGQRLQVQNAPLLEQLRAAGMQGHAGGERPRMTPEQREEMRQRHQSMTPEQREQMRARMQEQRQRGQQMTPEQREQMRARMQQMTPEQREQMRAQMRERGAQAPGARGQRGGPAARQVPEELRATMEQIRANREAAHQEAMAVLTPEQQARLRELAPQRRGAGERMNRRPAAR